MAERKSDVPADYQFSQNYPIPFNPTTTIRYGLPVSARVTLKADNVLGQEVATLVDEVQSAAMHQVVWYGLNRTGVPVASGPYF